MRYGIFSVTHYQENIQTCLLSNHTTWKYKQWTNEVFGIRIRQTFSPHDHDTYHYIPFLKNEDGRYEEVSTIDFNWAVERSKTKLAQLL